MIDEAQVLIEECEFRLLVNVKIFIKISFFFLEEKGRNIHPFYILMLNYKDFPIKILLTRFNLVYHHSTRVSVARSS